MDGCDAVSKSNMCEKADVAETIRMCAERSAAERADAVQQTSISHR